MSDTVRQTRVLLPCPFCGSNDIERSNNGDPHRTAFWTCCNECGVSTGEGGVYSQDQADARWNRRASQAPAAIAEPASPAVSGALREMEARKDAAYLERNQVVAALAKCFPSGVARTAIEGWSEDWHGCVYIDLPTGQASWHFHDSQAYLFDGLPPYTRSWDGHDTPTKYKRLAALASQPATEPPSMQPHLSPQAHWPFPAAGPKGPKL